MVNIILLVVNNQKIKHCYRDLPNFITHIMDETTHSTVCISDFFFFFCACVSACVCGLDLLSVCLCESNRRLKEGSGSVNFSISSSAEGEVER